MLARRLTTILPDLTLPEAIDTTRIHRVAGLLPHLPCGLGGRARDRGRTTGFSF